MPRKPKLAGAGKAGGQTELAEKAAAVTVEATAAAPKKRSKRSGGENPEAAVEPAAVSEKEALNHYVVGLGASAGGLEALSALISHLEPGLGASFVVVQHLSPSYKSMLPQLLARETALQVEELTSGQEPRPDTIYITPPNRDVRLKDGRLILIESPRDAMPKPSVNRFLASLAEERKEDAVGVVLSGTGSDGASGIRAVKAAGGFTFAQDPRTAKYDGMPNAAIDTGSVDWVLSPEDIAKEIGLLCRAQPMLPPKGDRKEPPLSSLKKLLAKVRMRTKLDFSGYKETTLWRRVERRMIANRTYTIEGYLEFVDRVPEELERLAKDVLISVTSFFRDREVFAALAPVVRQIVGRKNPGDEIRVWVPGCATGEEAYSIAILFHQVLGSSFDQYRVQIFATDVDMDAMQIARKGVYSETTLNDIDPQVVRDYFRPVHDRYEIVKMIRDVVIFARQDLVLDPPFLRLDLISCRNVLIYLQNALQAKILSLFHYALQPDGMLLLGKSESVSQQELLFSAEDKEGRIFRRRGISGRRLPAGVPAAAGGELALSAPSQIRSPNREHSLLRLASRFYMPPGVVVNAQLQVQHVLGDAGAFLQISPGRPSLDLMSLLGKELRVEAQTLVHNAEQKAASVYGRRRLPLRGDEGIPMRLAVHPFLMEGGERLFLVAFEKVAAPVHDEEGERVEDSALGRRELEDELVATREHLQTLVEELETSNEEMQALNEEVQAANEELQATNEELEAANEELQSTNEELLTINEELQSKSTELQLTNADLESIQNNVGMPILVVDAQSRILRFNTAAEMLFRMHRGMVGESLALLSLPLGMETFLPHVERAIRLRQPVEQPLRADTREYLLRVTLNYASQDRLLGAIVTLVDQTDLLATSRSWKESETRLRSVMTNSPTMMAIKEIRGRYEFVNPPYAAFYGRSCEDFIAHVDEQVVSAEIARLHRDQELVTLRTRGPVTTEDCVHVDGRPRYLLAIRFPLYDGSGEINSICIQAIDITDKRLAEDQLKLAARVIDRAAEAVMVTDPQMNIIKVNQAFSTITGYSHEDVVGKNPRILKSGRHDVAFYRRMWSEIAERGYWQGEIENRRKNGDIYTQWATFTAITNNQGDVINYVAIFSDVTALRESQRRAEFLALHDDLTGLPNRTLFNDRLKHAIARTPRSGTRLAVLFVDLDNFKEVNDSFGHDAGDVLLRQVADRLGSCVRVQDTVARLGGDEFTILMEDVHSNEVGALAVRIQKALNTPVVLRGHDVTVTASIGIAFYPDDGEDLQALMKSADTAMYRAKKEGRNTHAYSSEELRAQATERQNIQNALQLAIDAGEPYLVYQPLFRFDGGQLVGLEALMRWQSPTLGEVPPSKFIPIAEESGLILALTDLLVRRVLQQVRSWMDAGYDVPRVYFNISPVHVRLQNLGEQLMRQLERYDVPATAIGVEVSESGLQSVPDMAAATLLQLKGLGVDVSLDNMGTAASSLSRLARLPISNLKVDRTFLATIDTNGDAEGDIARAVIALGHSLGKTVIATGVETEKQRAALVKLGCAIGQGFLMASPQMPEHLETLLARRGPAVGG